MRSAVIYLGFDVDKGIDRSRFFECGVDICCEFNLFDLSKLRFVSKLAYEQSDGLIFVYSKKSWPDLQKTMLIEFERSSVFVEGEKPYVIAKGFKKLDDGIFFDVVYDKPVLFLPYDLKENVELNDILKPFNSNRRIVRVFGKDLSKDGFCVYSDEVESILSVPMDKLKDYSFAYTDCGKTPEEALFDVLLSKDKVKIATAESCTAGLVAARIANVPGVSKFLEGGAITYSNKLKVNVVKVDSNLLYRVGAVSEEVAYQMAVGALALTSADYAVSVTGIAGPTGATKTKPVGLVWFGFASKGRIETRKVVFSGNRRLIRDKSARFAILMLRSFILGE